MKYACNRVREFISSDGPENSAPPKRLQLVDRAARNAAKDCSLESTEPRDSVALRERYSLAWANVRGRIIENAKADAADITTKKISTHCCKWDFEK